MLPEIITPIPGPRSVALGKRLRKVESQTVTYIDADFPVFWQSARGVNVWDVDGNRFLDTTSAFGVCGLGHNADPVREAAVEQFKALSHAMGDVHPGEGKVLLCEQLSRLTFERWTGMRGKTLLCNSGFEAVEAALKTALLHTGKRGVLGFRGGYHGLGYGALEASNMNYFREPFRSQLGAFARHVDFPSATGNDLERIEKEIEAILRLDETGAMVVEPIQGRGGENIPPDGFLPMLRRLCDAFGVVLIFDEIYTGFLRTGRLFACEHWNTHPDIICLGKGLTAGFPLSACTAKAEIMDAWPQSNGEALHTSTFLGHPIGCAMALAALKEYENPEWARRIAETGQYFLEALKGISSPRIHQIRGKGLLIGVELRRPDQAPASTEAMHIVKKALKDGLLLLPGGPSGNVLSLAPPFVIERGEIDHITAKLQEYLTSLPGSIS